MSHIHIPDGIIPSLWWISGYIITAVMILLLIKKIGKQDMGTKIPLAGMSAAIMLVGMSVPLGFLPLHFSLAVLVGILVGPSIGFLVIFTVNVILALFGHGGITIVGINTVVIGTEVLFGYYLFRNLTKRISPTKSAAIATVIALLISMSMMVGIVGSTIGLPEALPHETSEEGEEHYHDEDDDHFDEEDEHNDYEEEHNDEGFVERVQTINYFALSGWTALIAILVVGVAFEATVTALIIRFLSKVRPDLIGK